MIKQSEYIKLHYNKTLTALQIANHLGMSRGAVIGRAYRMGLGTSDSVYESLNDEINARFFRKTQAIMDKRVGV